MAILIHVLVENSRQKKNFPNKNISQFNSFEMRNLMAKHIFMGLLYKIKLFCDGHSVFMFKKPSGLI